jgi:hypothetical protein
MKLCFAFLVAGVVTLVPSVRYGEAGTPSGIARSFDLVMTDDQCTILGVALGPDGAPKTADGSKFISVCARTGKKLSCRQQTRDDTDSVRHQGIDFVITAEEAPKMVMMSTDSLTLAIVDWARSEYILASTWMNQTKGVIQKQCKGTITTRDQLNDGPPVKRRRSTKSEADR